MNSWHDYTKMEAILPAVGWLFAIVIGIHSLWSPNVGHSLKRIIVIYIMISFVMAGLFEYLSVQNLRSNRETTKSIKTLLALAGVSNQDGINQGLDLLIARNIPPRQIIPTQEEVLANAFYVIKLLLPKLMHITYIQNSSDWTQIAVPIQRALARNGIDSRFNTQLASSPRETGIMFTMPDPRNPPDYALQLRDAFGIAGIRDISFVQMASDAVPLGFTIFVGPAPLK